MCLKVCFLHCVILLLTLSNIVRTEEQHRFKADKLVIVVLSQPQAYHEQRARVFDDHLQDQLENLNETPAAVYYAHEKWPDIPTWTVIPLLTDLSLLHNSGEVILFCEEETRIDLQRLLKSLSKYNFQEELFLGHGLRDSEATIIHHFAFHEKPRSFLYPDFAAGFILSGPLLTRLVFKLSDHPPRMDFSIDVKHELALYIYEDGRGVPLKNAIFLCTDSHPGEHCATWYPNKFPDCGKAISQDDVFFAVKTCEEFHKDRVPVVKETWGRQTRNIEFYSEKEDRSIPTVDIGVPNTKSGHCGKLRAILIRANSHPEISKKKWLVVTDDDTLLSVVRLRRLLACFDPNEPLVLGERYGYGSTTDHGYDYPTGGAGMVFSREVVRFLVERNTMHCQTDDAPDDMTLGIWLNSLGLTVTHSQFLHQARPQDYAADYLSHQLPVSFHKHWMVNPHKVYIDWLFQPDEPRDEL